MTRLADLHNRLAQLQRRRQHVRWETAYSALLLAVLWALAAAFLVDWLFEMNRPQRAILLLLSVGVVVWAFRKYTLPWLGQKETELDMALLVEREESIDSDLVAAVQFESPEAPDWGSIQLEQAVIEGIATKGGRINVMRGLSREELSRRSKLLLITGIVWVVVVLFLSGHVGVFLNRLLLGSKHYPTRTRIESMTINGCEIENPINPGSVPLMLRYGEPLKFEIRCSGSFPDKGTAKLAALHSGLRTTLALQPAEQQEDQPADSDEEIRTYIAELPRLVDSVHYQVFLGDAWTERGCLAVGQLPNVELQLEAIPPGYVKTSPQDIDRDLRQISVDEGSRVIVNIYSDKPLRDATVTVAEQAYPMQCVDREASPQPWRLDPPEDSPLFAVTAPVHYSVQVTDTDELQLDQPIEGTIRIQADSPPRIGAAFITEYVLPNAKPTIHLQAIDDYGVASIVMSRKVIREGKEVAKSQLKIYPVSDDQSPEKNLEKIYVFNLSALKSQGGDPVVLEKGDQIEVKLHAVDFRGYDQAGKLREGETASTDSLVFHVTDEAGIMEHVTRADQHTARQLKTMIQRQLGIGESP